MWDPEAIFIANIVSNAAALIMLFLSWKFPKAGRIIFMLLFGWASWVNSTTAIDNPQIYLDYVNYTPIQIYKDIIMGPFSVHIASIVISIAVCQALISISMIGKGSFFKAGVIGGIIFLLCIAPLGTGSAFPATVIMAAGLFILLRNSDSLLWKREMRSYD